MTSSLPVVRSASELTGKNGAQVRVKGTYGVQDLGGHALKVQRPDGSWEKVTRVAFVALEDGSFVSLEHRPDDEIEALEGKPVLAAGTLVIPDEPPSEPVMARSGPAPTLVEITSIEPPPDES